MIRLAQARNTIIGAFTGVTIAIVFTMIFATPHFQILSLNLLKPIGLIFVGTIGGMVGAITGTIVQKVLKLSLLAIPWTGLIIGVIPSIIIAFNSSSIINIDILNAPYKVYLIEGLVVFFLNIGIALLKIGFILLAFPSFGLLYCIVLYILWKFVEIGTRKIIVE